MQINDEVRKCVVFLGYKSPEGDVFAGTGFFVSVGLPDVPGRSLMYLVTARHNLYEVDRRSIDGKVLETISKRDSRYNIVTN